MIAWIYWYCTDFCLNLANWLGISYVEVNTWLFLVLVPMSMLLLFLLNVYRYLIRPLWQKAIAPQCASHS